MDRTLVNLASILVGGAGLLTVLTGFNVPQLNASFFGENPYAIKRDAIEATMQWVFAIVALSGLLLQFWAEIWGAHLSDRSHKRKYYINFSLGGLVVVGLLVWGLTGIGKRVAKMQWEPAVIASQRELFDRAKFVAQHGGWTPEHWPNRDTITRSGDDNRYKANNVRTAEEHVSQLEDLLEIRSQGDLNQRLAVLERFFTK